MFNDFDSALESGDARSCEYCGHVEYVDVGFSGHVCEGMREASRKQTENFNRNYFGEGGTRRTRIVIDIIAPPTTAALASAVQDFTTWKLDEMGGGGTETGGDQLLGWEWAATVTHEN